MSNFWTESAALTAQIEDLKVKLSSMEKTHAADNETIKKIMDDIMSLRRKRQDLLIKYTGISARA